MESLENNLKYFYDNKKILSIQSHVVHGYAGNKCSSFIFQVNIYFLLLNFIIIITVAWF